MLPQQARSPLFPYTTLFRSIRLNFDVASHADEADGNTVGEDGLHLLDGLEAEGAVQRLAGKRRSEEHTSELQSQSNLVCRLLLEKKNCSLATGVNLCRAHTV